MANSICHWEIIGSEGNKDFYSKIFDWQFQNMFPGYDYVAPPDGFPVGGGVGSPSGQAPGVYLYFHVDSIEDTLAKAEAAGATVVMPKEEIPNVGFIAMFRDLDGNIIGIHTPPAGM